MNYNRENDRRKNEIVEKDNPGILGALKLFALGLIGGLVGGFPFAVLLCAFDTFSILLMILCGAGAAAFVFALGHAKTGSVKSHFMIVLNSIVTPAVIYVISVLIHYVPMIPSTPRGNGALQKLAFYLFDFAPSNLDAVKGGAIETTDGGLNPYTVLLAAVVLSLIGAYAVFVMLVLYKRKTAKEKTNTDET